MQACKIPQGFELMPTMGAFGEIFGPVYRDEGGCKLGLFLSEQHLNPANVSHGGVIATFADMQILAVTPLSGPDAVLRPTVSLTVDYLEPIQARAWVEAAVSLVKMTRTLVFTQALITADGRIAARSQGIYRNYASQNASERARENLRPRP